MERNAKINMTIIDANVKLQDENKVLKKDNELLQKRMNLTAQYLKSKMNKFEVFDLKEEIKDAIDMLEGNYVFKERSNL